MEPIISLENVSKVYLIGQSRTKALDSVSLTIERGEFCCIVGRSGSGKSTLLNMIAGLEPPTKGSILVDGSRIDKLNEARLVRYRLDHVGFIFQSFNLFETHTAVDNVAMPLMFKGVPRSVRTRVAMKMLASLGLESHFKHKPSQMSGGQQQRVSIARALVVKPDIIFADEPTGNLDSKTAFDIMELMQKIVRERGHTLIMVTHDLDMAKYADRVVHILDGKIVNIEVNEKKTSPTDNT